MSESRRIPPHAIDRPTLRAQLDAGIEAPLVLVVAPAGAGKTVLLGQWAQSRPDLPVAWLDIDIADRDAVTLSQHLTTAIATVVPGFRAPRSVIETAENRLGEPFLEELAAGLADQAPLAVVFDDLDRLGDAPVLTDLWRIVDLLPAGVHFVFASRVDLQLGWSRHRLQHGLVEIRQHALAFDPATTADVIRAITGRPVSAEAAEAVTTRTEGWAAGVQLTALTLRFAADPDRVVDALADTDRLVVDYLSGEVLDGLDATRRMSLKRIAVLDQFCASLVEAIVDVRGDEFIAALERDSLFVVPVPGQPGWYRFHRLFRDLLLLRLRARAPQVEAEALDAAASWYLEEGKLSEAVECLLRGRRWQRALELILGFGRDVFEQQRTQAVARALERVPTEVRERHVDAAILLAILEGMSGRWVEAVDTLRMLAADDTLTVGRQQVVLAYLSATVQFQPDVDLVLDAGRRALLLLQQHPDAERPPLLGLTARPLLWVLAQASVGRAHLFQGEFGAARAALTRVLAMDGIAYRPYRIHALGSLAIVEAIAGRLEVAAGLADQALELAAEFGFLVHPAPADAYIARSLVAIQRGESDVGGLALAEGSVRASSNQRTQLMWIARLASLIIDTSHGTGAVPEPEAPPPLFVRQAIAAQAMRRARLHGEPVEPTSIPTPGWSILAFEEVAALLEHGHAAAARARLGHLRVEPDPLSITTKVERDLLLGWLAAVEGRRAPTREHLRAALQHAEPQWLVHPFIRAGATVADLLDELPGAANEFRRLVVRRARATAALRQQPLADELTPRELELLAYLPSRLTIAEIAARCFVSTNTVKTHMGHIYRKLEVTGRDAAIARATELGLLDEPEIAHTG